MRIAPHRVTPHSSTAPSMSARVTMPRTTEGDALDFQSNKFEYLSAGDQHGIKQVEPTGLPQSCDFPFIELPEFFFIKTVKPFGLQWRSIIQHDVEHDGSKKIQRERGRNELLGRPFSCDQFTQDGQYFLEI